MASSRSTPSFHRAGPLFLLLLSLSTHTHDAEGSIEEDNQPSYTPAVPALLLSLPVISTGRHQRGLSPPMKDKGAATSREMLSAGWLAPRNHGIPLATSTHPTHDYLDMLRHTLVHTHSGLCVELGQTRGAGPVC